MSYEDPALVLPMFGARGPSGARRPVVLLVLAVVTEVVMAAGEVMDLPPSDLCSWTEFNLPVEADAS